MLTKCKSTASTAPSPCHISLFSISLTIPQEQDRKERCLYLILLFLHLNETYIVCNTTGKNIYKIQWELNKRGGCHSYSPTYTFFKPVKHILYSLRSHDYKTVYNFTWDGGNFSQFLFCTAIHKNLLNLIELKLNLSL